MHSSQIMAAQTTALSREGSVLGFYFIYFKITFHSEADMLICLKNAFVKILGMQLPVVILPSR